MKPAKTKAVKVEKPDYKLKTYPAKTEKAPVKHEEVKVSKPIDPSGKFSFGWIPQLPDQRDLVCNLSAAPVALPKSADLRQHLPFPMDQGRIGSCVGNATAACHMALQEIEGRVAVPISRLFIYYTAREMEGTVQSDAGCVIRDAFKLLSNLGAPKEDLWPYDVSKFKDKPSEISYEDALTRQAIKYESVPQDLQSLKACLALGYPFVFGFAVYESFQDSYTAQTGLMRMPRNNEKLLGGHAVLCCGYNDKKKHFIVRNSWGPNWGFRGDFFMPYDVMLKHARDFWTIKDVE